MVTGAMATSLASYFCLCLFCVALIDMFWFWFILPILSLSFLLIITFKLTDFFQYSFLNFSVSPLSK